MKKNIQENCNRNTIFIATVFMLLLIFPLFSNAQTGKTDFAGDWTFNAEKSTPQGGQGGGGPRMGGNVVVTQDANTLTVVRTRTGQDGQETTTTMKYTLDGKESINTSPRGDSKSVATWSSDGKTVSIATTRTFEMNGESRTMQSTEVWKLTDPKTLIVTSTRQGQDGEVKSDLVYDKK
jgi:GTPase involved in cell partitioning and DNA repair